MKIWQLQEAKNKLSHVVDNAQTQGPQVITRRGVEVAVIIAYDQYQQMAASKPSLSEFFGASPLADAEIDLERDASAIGDPLQL